MAETAKLNPGSPQRGLVDRTARLLRDGGVAAFPTDTVYGLGCSAGSRGGLLRLRELKGRPAAPFIVLLAGEEWLADVARDVTPLARELIRRHWPGALTLVFDAAPGLIEGVRSEEGTVAVRVPGSGFCLSLCKALRAPVVSTSANIPGASPASNAEEVAKTFGDSLDLIIDGGETMGPRPSTLVDVRGEQPVVLRAGAVSLDDGAPA